MIESDLVINAVHLHGIKTRGMVLDCMGMAWKLKKLTTWAATLETKCKKKGKR